MFIFTSPAIFLLLFIGWHLANLDSSARSFSRNDFQTPGKSTQSSRRFCQWHIKENTSTISHRLLLCPLEKKSFPIQGISETGSNEGKILPIEANCFTGIWVGFFDYFIFHLLLLGHKILTLFPWNGGLSMELDWKIMCLKAVRGWNETFKQLIWGSLHQVKKAKNAF